MEDIISKIKNDKKIIAGIVLAFVALVAGGLIVINQVEDDESVQSNSLEYATVTYVDDFGFSQYIEAELALTNEQRREGLMNRHSLPLSEGMLFVFSDETPRTFWMKDTFIPLDIIFINSELKVVKIHRDTKVNQTSEVYSTATPAKYALEVNAGWAEQVGLSDGDQLFLDKIFE